MFALCAIVSQPPYLGPAEGVVVVVVEVVGAVVVGEDVVGIVEVGDTVPVTVVLVVVWVGSLPHEVRTVVATSRKHSTNANLFKSVLPPLKIVR